MVPKAIRDALGIGPCSVLAWQVRDGIAEVYCIPEDPVRAARGMLRGKGISVADLLEERRLDRESEARREATLERILDECPTTS